VAASAAASRSRLPSADEVSGAVLVAFDPGRHVGVAWVTAGGSLLHGAIVGLADLPHLPVPAGARVVAGDGTGSRALAAGLAELGVVAERIDETGTSEVARLLYWRRHPARGVHRLVPLGLRVPPRPIDDFAAYAIALRALGPRTGAAVGERPSTRPATASRRRGRR
jgi:hypothetical protein